MTSSTAKRGLFVGGNWKCNPNTKASVLKLCNELNDQLKVPKGTTVVVAPTALHLSLAQSALKHPDVSFAVQNVWKDAKAGAWTGELTVDMVKDFGVDWVILGHSERRSVVSGETSALVASKVRVALDADLKVIACVGEKLEERNAGTTLDVLVEQLAPICECIQSSEAWKRVVIAYEPVWAIGTGVVATPEQAEETQANIRTFLRGKVSAAVADNLQIIYGGSVNAKNCGDLIKQPNIDGFLVGGASLKGGEFATIVSSTASKASGDGAKM